MRVLSSQPTEPTLSSPIVFLLKEENWGLETFVFLTSHHTANGSFSGSFTAHFYSLRNNFFSPLF